MEDKILECTITDIDEMGRTMCVEKETGRKIIIENPDPTRLIIRMSEK